MNDKCWWGCRKIRTFIHCCGSAIESCPTLTTPWTTVACQAPLPGQEYRSRLPFPSPGDLPNLGIELESLALESPALLSHQQSPIYIVGRTANGVATLENSLAVPQKVKYGVTIWVSNLTPRYTPKIIEYRCLMKICMWIFIATLFTIVRRWKQPLCLTTDEWINKMYIHTMDVLIAQLCQDGNGQI